MFPSEMGKSLAEVPAFLPKPGGAPANVAVCAKRLGVSSAFIGKVGDEAFGHFLAHTLAAEGVETRGMVFDDYARTTMAFIAMKDENHPEFVFYRNPGADTQLRPEELDADLLRNSKAFHFGSLSLNVEPARSATIAAIEHAHQGEGIVSFDVNYRPTLWSSPDEAVEVTKTVVSKVDVVKVNEDEVALLSGQEKVEIDEASLAEASRLIVEQGPTLVVVTLGPHGSYFRTENAGGFAPGFHVNAIDAVGAGDAFIAGMLTRLVQADNWLSPDYLKESLRFANAVGALATLTQGTIPAMPTLAAVEEFLSEN